MKGKRFLLVLALGFVFLSFTVNAEAENRWGYFKVASVGPAYGNMFILLRGTGENPPFGERWCMPNPGQEKEMLAVALTAMANGMTLHGCIGVDQSSDVFIIHALYLIDQ
jgi:hypothetical protein